MGSRATENLIKNLSFDVEAVPNKNTLDSKTSNSGAPMNLKIRVRKKDGVLHKNTVLTIPNVSHPEKAPGKVRLAGSDQTIMSFNVFMETDSEIRPPKKHRKVFGGCFGTQSDDEEAPYEPGTAQMDCKSNTLAALQENDINSVDNADNGNTKLFGKCKPGGCLDPPFGEDKYQYKPRISENKNKPMKDLAIEDLKKYEILTENQTKNRPRKSRDQVVILPIPFKSPQTVEETLSPHNRIRGDKSSMDNDSSTKNSKALVENEILNIIDKRNNDVESNSGAQNLDMLYQPSNYNNKGSRNHSPDLDNIRNNAKEKELQPKQIKKLLSGAEKNNEDILNALNDTYSIITYPLTISSSELELEEKKNRRKSISKRNSSPGKTQQISNEFTSEFFIPPKTYKDTIKSNSRPLKASKERISTKTNRNISGLLQKDTHSKESHKIVDIDRASETKLSADSMGSIDILTNKTSQPRKSSDILKTSQYVVTNDSETSDIKNNKIPKSTCIPLDDLSRSQQDNSRLNRENTRVISNAVNEDINKQYSEIQEINTVDDDIVMQGSERQKQTLSQPLKLNTVDSSDISTPSIAGPPRAFLSREDSIGINDPREPIDSKNSNQITTDHIQDSVYDKNSINDSFIVDNDSGTKSPYKFVNYTDLVIGKYIPTDENGSIAENITLADKTKAFTDENTTTAATNNNLQDKYTYNVLSKDSYERQEQTKYLISNDEALVYDKEYNNAPEQMIEKNASDKNLIQSQDPNDLKHRYEKFSEVDSLSISNPGYKLLSENTTYYADNDTDSRISRPGYIGLSNTENSTNLPIKQMPESIDKGIRSEDRSDFPRHDGSDRLSVNQLPPRNYLVDSVKVQVHDRPEEHTNYKTIEERSSVGEQRKYVHNNDDTTLLYREGSQVSKQNESIFLNSVIQKTVSDESKNYKATEKRSLGELEGKYIENKDDTTSYIEGSHASKQKESTVLDSSLQKTSTDASNNYKMTVEHSSGEVEEKYFDNKDDALSYMEGSHTSIQKDSIVLDSAFQKTASDPSKNYKATGERSSGELEGKYVHNKDDTTSYMEGSLAIKQKESIVLDSASQKTPTDAINNYKTIVEHSLLKVDAKYVHNKDESLSYREGSHASKQKESIFLDSAFQKTASYASINNKTTGERSSGDIERKYVNDKDNTTLYNEVRHASKQKAYIVLDLAFQKSASDASSKVFVKTLDSGSNSSDHNGQVVVVKTVLNKQNDKVRVAIDDYNELSIKYEKVHPGSPESIRRISFIRAASTNQKPVDSTEKMEKMLHLSMKDDRKGDIRAPLHPLISLDGLGGDIHQTLSAIYEKQLVPLQKTIKSLKEDIDFLANEQHLLRNRVQKTSSSRRLRPVRVIHSSKRCVCISPRY